ncbi:MAG: tetratricopeptide repeat protein [Trueperaceae bacterium]
MHKCTTALIRRTAHLLAALVITASAFATSLVVYPFTSQDPVLGVAMADEVAAAFFDHAIVLGPDVAAGVVPPLVVIDGYINIGRVLGSAVWTSHTGPGLLRSGAGVDVAVSGTVEQYDERTVLRLEVAYPGGARHAELIAEPGDRGRLVSQAVRVVAPLLGLEAAPTPVASPPLEGAYGDYVQALFLAASGLVTDAAAVRPQMQDPNWPARGSELFDDLRAVVDGNVHLAQASVLAPSDAARRVARRALMALALDTLHEAGAEAAFGVLAELTGLGVAHAWGGILASDRGDFEAAEAAFVGAAAADYPYALALQASLQLAFGNAGAALDLVDQVSNLGPAAGSAALTGAYTVALLAEDITRQKTALLALSRAAPFLAYPLQELSFIAFDEDDALAAAEALAVAVELEPDSSLFWTNLGWARYLLGFLDASAEASQRAVALDGNAYIAAYNLGLVHAVEGRLRAALESYDYAVSLDPAIHDEVIVDLVNARDLYPGVSAVEYALARLYEAKGQRQLARDAYRRFVQLAADEGRADEYAEYLQVAHTRVDALGAPLPPLEIFGEVALRLGQRGPVAEPFHPGDPLFPSFELSTAGDQLPGLVNVTLALLPADAEAGAEPLASASAAVEVPPGAVGYVVDFVWLPLPTDLAAGTYRLEVNAVSGAELAVEAFTTFRVAGAVEPLRQLFGRNVVMTGLEIDTPLYGRDDLAAADRVVGRMLQELRDAAPAAEAALPTVSGGRYDGMTGSQVFLGASAGDISEFLAYVVASDTNNARFTFVDAFAQWALDGAPTAF